MSTTEWAKTDPAADQTGDTATAQWKLAGSLTAAAVIGVLFAAAGLLLSRVDLALLALPFIVCAVLAAQQRPQQGQKSTATITLAAHSGYSELPFTVDIEPPAGTETILLRLVSCGGKEYEVAVTAESAHQLRGQVPVLHSGPQEALRVDYRLLAMDSAFWSVPLGPLLVHRVVPPPFTAISNLPLPHRLQGLTGTHDSARPGDGGDFRDIHPFAPGDRLRRIDWKTTARRSQFAGDLYVRRTAATADATVVVVVDSRDDVGEQVAQWSRNSAAEKGLGSMDLAREAGSSIAAGYIRSGDRVGFQDLASQSRLIPPGGGDRHLHRVLQAIALTQPSGAPKHRLRPPIVMSGSLIYVFSTFLDEEAARMATLWRGSGHRVIAVDVLPTPRFSRATWSERVAHRVVVMERADRIRTLQAQGVELLRWQEDGDSGLREAHLRILSRPRGERR